MPDPDINTIYDAKKLLGCCVEKFGDCQVALCPKCYTIWTNNTTKALKLKGLSLGKNKIDRNDYVDAIKNNSIKYGKNINLQMNKGVMTKITTTKIAVNARHTKMITLSNQSCVPYVHGVPAANVLIACTT